MARRISTQNQSLARSKTSARCCIKATSMIFSGGCRSSYPASSFPISCAVSAAFCKSSMRSSNSPMSSNVSHYMSLPIGEFDERIELLQKAAETAHEIGNELAGYEDLQPPEKIMLVALMQHLADVFERAKLWFCVEMRRAMDSHAKDRFWILSAYSTDP